MVKVVYHNKSYQIAEQYNELNRSQLIALAPLLSKKEDPAVLNLRVLKILLQMGRIRFYFLDIELKDLLLSLTAWVFDKNKLTKQLMISYSHWMRRFYGPKSDFDNITLSEYHCTEIYYQMLLENKAEEKKVEALNALISVLYRIGKTNYNFKIDPDGDGREIFNEYEIEYWSKQIAHWPSNIKQAILLWYDGCRENLVALYPAVFRPADTASSDYTKGMFSVMRGLSDGGKYGSFNEVKKLNLHTALMEMEQLIKEADELKKMQ